MNVGYILSIISKQIVGFIAVNTDYLMYHTDDSMLQAYIELLLKNCNIIDSYITELINNEPKITGYKFTNPIDMHYLHGLSFKLPWPYYIGKVRYELIDIKDINIKNLMGRDSDI